MIADAIRLLPKDEQPAPVLAKSGQSGRAKKNWRKSRNSPRLGKRNWKHGYPILGKRSRTTRKPHLLRRARSCRFSSIRRQGTGVSIAGGNSQPRALCEKGLSCRCHSFGFVSHARDIERFERAPRARGLGCVLTEPTYFRVYANRFGVISSEEESLPRLIISGKWATGQPTPNFLTIWRSLSWKTDGPPSGSYAIGSFEYLSMSSKGAYAVEVDPLNDLFSRQNRRRLEVEAIGTPCSWQVDGFPLPLKAWTRRDPCSKNSTATRFPKCSKSSII